MVEIGNTLVSLSLLEEHFVCDLKSCKGICCVEGDSGAPLEPEEIAKLSKDYKEVEPFLTLGGKTSIAQQGVSVTSKEGDLETPLIDGGPCAYVIKENGIYTCGIQKAYQENKIDWQKPISCHLYPIRLGKTKTHTLVNYEKWSICKPACKLGKRLSVPVYKFVKGALVRRFGEPWYLELDQVATELKKRES